MTSTDLAVPERVLAIGAHPDDIEFGCGATLAKWSARGTTVDLCVLTDGSKGTWDPDRDPTELAATRKAEQRDAADRLGVNDVFMIGAIDGELENTLALREQVCRVLRTSRPGVVFGHDPWKRYRLHPDHQHAGMLAIEGIVAARDPHFFRSLGIPPHRPHTVLLFEPDEIDHVEVVDEIDVRSRVDALLAHASQWESTMHIGSDVDADRRRFVEAQFDECRTAGAIVGALYGEAFKRIDDL